MRDSMHPKRLCRSVPMRLLASVVVSGVLVTGCGGGSPGSTNGTVNGGTPAGASTASAGRARTTVSSAGAAGALAYAKCMRANGVPNFPDPSPGGGFDINGNAGAMSSPAFKAAQAKCGTLMGGGPLSAGPPASAQTMAQLRKIAVCMRAHGVPQFPDPLASVPHGFHPSPTEYREITNYQGAILLYPATIDPQSPAYEHATAVCGAGFLAGNNAH